MVSLKNPIIMLFGDNMFSNFMQAFIAAMNEQDHYEEIDFINS